MLLQFFRITSYCAEYGDLILLYDNFSQLCHLLPHLLALTPKATILITPANDKNTPITWLNVNPRPVISLNSSYWGVCISVAVVS